MVVGRAAACNGSASRLLGVLAAARGEWARAERHFADALAMHVAMGARPFEARTQLAWAEMELARGEAGRARELLADAIVIADALGMVVVAERARGLVTAARAERPTAAFRGAGSAGGVRVDSAPPIAAIGDVRGRAAAFRLSLTGQLKFAPPGANPSGRRLPSSDAMARSATTFTCSACGHEAPKWHGRCLGCGEWNTIVEETRRPRAARRARPPARAARPVRLADVEAVKVARLSTGIAELDRVLGGGLVPGSLVLLGGSPGIGKSTLTSMALGNLAGAGRRTLYVSGEESAAQIKLRAERLPGAALEVPVLAETDLDTVLATLDAERPEVCVVDSVQTLHAADLTGAAGSVGQVREVADRITRLAKARDIAVLLVGHVTKEGALAGPRVLEHLVDCVLQFEGERERTYRTLRALKNRFGSTSEAGVFEMRQGGLVEVQDASARFVGEATRAPGSVVLAAMEGSRPLLVEVQALVSPSELVPPRRVANGIDRNRLALVLAVLARHAGVGVGSADVFVNVAGGVRIDEPGADLAVALAVASAARGVVAGRGRAPDRVLRRDRPDGRAAQRRTPGAAAGGGGQVRPGADDRAGRRRRPVDRGADPQGGVEGGAGASSAIRAGPREGRLTSFARAPAPPLPAPALACSNRFDNPLNSPLLEPNRGVNSE